MNRQVFINNGKSVQLYAIEGNNGTNINNCASGCAGNCSVGGDPPPTIDVGPSVIAGVLTGVITDVIVTTIGKD